MTAAGAPEGLFGALVVAEADVPAVIRRLIADPRIGAVTITGSEVHGALEGALLVAGTGSGLFIAPNAQFIIANVDRTEAGAASGVIATMQRLGSAIGIAIIGSVFFGALSIPAQGPPTANDLAVAFTHSATSALAVSASFAVVAFLLVFALPKRLGSGSPRSPAQLPEIPR